MENIFKRIGKNINIKKLSYYLITENKKYVVKILNQRKAWKV